MTSLSDAYRLFQAKAKIGGDEIRAALPAGSCLIDFWEYCHFAPPLKGMKEPVIERRLLAFVVKPGRAKVELVHFGPAKPLAQLIERWRSGYGTGPGDPGGELRRRVWDKLTPHLGGIRTVLVSPDGPLTGLPFAALPGSKPNTFLVEDDYAIVTVPVPQMLPELLRADTGRPAGAAPSLLLVGDVDFGTAGDGTATYRPLPGTAAEIDAVRTSFANRFAGGGTTVVLRSDKAVRAEFVAQASRQRYLHLATHGFFADESVKSALAADSHEGGLPLLRFGRGVVGTNPGLLSGLVFAGVNQDRGRGLLTALAAGDLDLRNTDLVVLSACETGRGRSAGGEGVLGLQRAFQVAGARGVVASLWSVDDRATQALMTRFYDNLWGKQMPTADALREAQRWMLTDGRQTLGITRGLERLGPAAAPTKDGRLPPYYWAAFVLAGDWR